MAVSFLDAHPNNECIDLSTNEAWFSFIFCGSRIDKLNLRVYDYYTGKEVANGEPNIIYSPSIHTDLQTVSGGVGNGVRVNIKDFVKDTNQVFNADGEYTWRAELIQKIDIANGLCPDNMVYEGAIVGEPSLTAKIDNIQGFNYNNYLPLTLDISERIKPPYYVDFLDSKYNGQAYDIPVTYDETRVRSDGETYTAIQLTTYASTVKDTDALLRPNIGTEVRIHKKKHYGNPQIYSTSNPNMIYIDNKIPYISRSDNESDLFAADGCYLKVGSEYFPIVFYDKSTGAVTCQNGNRLREYPAGTHYAIYTTRFWTPHYYFRVHDMPTLSVGAEFHEHRRIQQTHYDDTVNCLDNTFNGVLFKASLNGASHAAVKYFYWEIFNAATNKRLLKTERIYSQEMDCEFFLPFGNEYIGRITVVTQDGITLSGDVRYRLPASPQENDERLVLKAYQNRFGGIELAWTYRYWQDNSSLLKANQFEVFRIDKRLGKTKYLGKVDFSPVAINGIVPAASGGNWYLIDQTSDFSLKTPAGAKVNMYLVGGGSDGGSWKVTPNGSNASFAVSENGGQGGCFSKQSITSTNGLLDFHVNVAERNNNTGTTVSVGGRTYKCNDAGYSQRGSVKGNTMTQTSGISVVYNNDAQNGANGFSTPYGIVGSSGGGGASCGGTKSNGDVKELSVSGINLNSGHNKGNWILIDRNDLGGGTGSFNLNVPDGATIKMYLVGGGSDGGYWSSKSIDGWDVNGSIWNFGGGSGYFLEKEISVSGTVTCNAVIADRNDNGGTQITIGGVTYKCTDNGWKRNKDTNSALVLDLRTGSQYEPAELGRPGFNSPAGIVCSSGGGGGYNNGIHMEQGAPGGEGAGKGGAVDSSTAYDGTDSAYYSYENKYYGCGGGGGSGWEAGNGTYMTAGNVYRSKPGKGAPGCIIFEITDIAEVICPDPGVGGTGAGDGGFPGENGGNATQYGCGGGGSGYWATDSHGNYSTGKVGLGMRGCVILEIEYDGGRESNIAEEVYAVDWTAASDKEYQYIITGCNYESSYTARHDPEDMIECTASVDIKPHFRDFYIYFLNDADILRDTKLNYENYETPLIEPMGRYMTSRNNNYRMIKRHNHTLALEREDKSYYRRHTWRIEGDVTLGEVTHNITRNVNPLYAQMPAVTDEGTNYDSFPMSFLFGYLDCDAAHGSGFTYNDQYLFELWKKCVFEKGTVMIKDPKGNVWTGTLNAHGYQVEYDTGGMPYVINVDFTQTRTEHNTRVMIVDDHNVYLKTVKNNHLK